MNQRERIERAARAQRAMDEFFTPALAEIEADYAEKMIAAAASTDPRANEIITRLGQGIKAARQVKALVEAHIADGAFAERERQADMKMAEMSDPQKRLLRIAPQ